MVKIRLARHGAKKRPYYHIVVTDSESPRDGRFLEQVGTYDPSREDTDIRLDLERVDHWIGGGAKPSHPVRNLIKTCRRLAAAAADAPAVAPKAEEPKADAAEAGA